MLLIGRELGEPDLGLWERRRAGIPFDHAPVYPDGIVALPCYAIGAACVHQVTGLQIGHIGCSRGALVCRGGLGVLTRVLFGATEQRVRRSGQAGRWIRSEKCAEVLQGDCTMIVV